MRKEFKMTDKQHKKIMDACKSVPYMVFGGVQPRSPQENVNDAWRVLGDKLGFEHMTVEPVQGKGGKFFTAENRRPL